MSDLIYIFAERTTQMANIKPFTKDRFAKVSKEILDKNYRTKLGLHAQKLLYGLASCLEESETMFPEWQIHIDGLFKYLNVENSNKRYEYVRDAIGEIAKNPLEYRVNEKKWGYLTWLSMAKFDEESSSYVTIRFGNDVKPFLLGLKEYCRLDAQYYIELSGNYAMWLYPLLRNVANKREAYLELTLKEIKELTYNEKTPAYNPEKNRNANADLLKRVVGIEKKQGSKYYTPVEKVTTDGEIKESGAIAEINDKTDLYVECEVLKQGRSIHTVRFNVLFKADTFQGKRKAIRKAHRTDFKKDGSRQLVIEEIRNGIDKDRVSVLISTVEEMAKAQGKMVGDLLREMGYRRDGERAFKI